MIIGRNFIEKLYSENYSEYEDTKLYSTGDSELDDLLEKAFCEGYEYAQKEFGNPLNKAAKRKWVLEQGKKAIFDKAHKNKWDSFRVSDSLADKGKILREGRKKISSITPKIGKNIKDRYEKSDIHGKINLRDELVNTRKSKLRIQNNVIDQCSHPGKPSVEFKELGNSRKLIKRSNISDKAKNRLLHGYDHGDVDKRGKLIDGVNMGMGNYAHNVFRAGSGKGYNMDWSWGNYDD